MTASWALPAIASALLAITDPVVVIDLNPGPESSSPGPLIPLGKGVVFSAFLPEVGRELFLSDGTAAGTRLIADLIPGPVGSYPEELTALGDEVYFRARDADGRWALYGTDGGDVRLVRHGVLSSLTALNHPNVGGRLIFRAEDGSIVSLDPHGGFEEYLTRTVSYYPVSGDGRLLALAGHGGDILVTNGSRDGTLVIEGVDLGGYPTPYLGKLAIVTIGWRVLLTDGTASGTRFLPVEAVRWILGSAGRNLFMAKLQGGSVFALDEHDRTRSLGVPWFQDQPRFLAGRVNGRFLFTGERQPHALEGEPFGTDGSSADLLGDLVPGPAIYCGGPTVYVCRGASLPRSFMEARRVTYFVAGESEHLAIWRTDGTTEGTAPITTSEYVELANPVLTDQGIFVGAHRRETGYEPAFLPLHLPKAVQVPVAPCRLWSSDVLPGTKTNVAVEGHCGVPVGAYSVQIDLTATFPDRTVSTVRLAASGAVPPAAATRFFGPKASRATQTVNIGPHGITVWNEGPGPGAIRISLDVSGYEAPEN